MRIGLILTLALVALALVSANNTTHQVFLPIVRDDQMDVTNPGFEAGSWQATAYYDLARDRTLHHDQFNEIRPGAGWTAWWIEGLASWQYGVVTGRPEVAVIGSIPDPLRVSEGDKALKWFTFWRPNAGGIAQQVDGVTVYFKSFATHGLRHADLYIDNVTMWRDGDRVTVQVDIHAWYSQCDHEPHAGPLEADCVTPITWAHQFLYIGLDPTGGEIDPTRPDIQWSEPFECYGEYCRAQYSVELGEE